jgi:hypothetical protein
MRKIGWGRFRLRLRLRLRGSVARLVIGLALWTVGRGFRELARKKLAAGPNEPVHTGEQVVAVLSRENGAQPYKRRVIQ